ncbi:DUF2231 domain-containing protein [Microbacterium sp. CFH 90308]|uniref:DUF2231 domain-containing protein n=1 Tax=Microbacterium salsuginis TaxID=2722803 RepID=A0ABX1KK50_9MICO|nr:DUF2231 domain-containing protein [Microbacterium sp. CFH 90308]NLP85746.1 DUF2231 domain-containing protein [Microbacterium sp. CFH 90308]
MSETTPQHRAKRPRSAIAGPYGHPFHPILVTIPIGTWAASLVFDIIALASDDPAPFVVGARVLILIGIVGAVLAAAIGLVDYAQLARGTAARKTATVHMALNLGVTVLFLVNLLLRWSADDDEVSIVGFILSIVALGALGVSGWLGGKLAYHYGVRVADERTQAEGFR